MKTKAYEHQKEMVRFACDEGKSLFLCGTGTGKAWASLSVCEKMKVKTLVVCPASLITNWGAEIEKHTNLSAILLQGTLDKRKELLKGTADIYVINYEILVKMEKELIRMNFGLVIIDEIHRAKGRTTKQSKSLYNISRFIRNRIGMSGTLIANGYEDLYMPCKIINQDIFGTRWKTFEELFIVKYGATSSRVYAIDISARLFLSVSTFLYPTV